MRPTLRQLEYLVAVADHRSFQRAAQACFVTQPGLSTQIRQLERILGVTLFERDRRRVAPTAAAEQILERARALLLEVDDLKATARGTTRPLEGRLRLGVIPTIAPYLLPRRLPVVRKRHPKLQLQLHEAPTESLRSRLERGELDLLLVALEADLGRNTVAPLFRDELMVALPADHALSKRKSVRQRDLLDSPWLLLEQGH